MKKLIIALSVFVSYQAFADFAGNWQGTNGQMTGSEKSSCDPIRLAIAQSATSVTIANSAYSCGAVTMDAGSITFVVSNGNLYFGGNKAGEITDALVAYNIEGNGNAVTMSLDATNGVYSTSTVMQGFGKFFVRATLTRH